MEWVDVIPHLTGLAHLATTDGAGHPGVATVAPQLDGHHIWFQTRATSRKARNVAANPAVAMMWQPGGEAYVWGTAEVIDDVAEKRRLWAGWPYDAAGFFGTPEDPGVVVVRVRPGRATVLAVGEQGPVRRTWLA